MLPLVIISHVIILNASAVAMRALQHGRAQRSRHHHHVICAAYSAAQTYNPKESF
jgi:hypothetical protein